MAGLLEAVAEASYAGVFAVLVAANAAPLLMPPTWLILASFHAVDPSLEPLQLALVGATGATLGRLALKTASARFRRLAGEERRAGLDAAGAILGRRRYGYALASFLFAATPLPSGMLFVAYGLVRARGAALYAGFWAGRAISYYVMVSVSEFVLAPLLELFEDRLAGILAADAAGVASVVLFASVDWRELAARRRLRLVRPRLWRL